MENKKMWVGLVKQMIYEIVILFLLYLFIGNNFGNNVFSGSWVSAILEWRFVSEIFFSGSNCECSMGLIFIGYPILVVVAIFNLIFLFSMFWMPVFLTYMLCFNGVLKSCVKSFGGQYPNIALPKIQDWYKKSKKVYNVFVIISRVVFVLLLLFKALNAPLDYIADFFLFKWEMSGNLMSILIFSVGAVIRFSLCFFRFYAIVRPKI